jgi:hypothetical protein
VDPQVSLRDEAAGRDLGCLNIVALHQAKHPPAAPPAAVHMATATATAPPAPACIYGHLAAIYTTVALNYLLCRYDFVFYREHSERAGLSAR